MWYYQEIVLHPTADAPESFMMAKIYGKLHLALSESMDAAGKIHCGVAFPEYSLMPKTLGKKIRILSQDEDALESLAVDSVLSLFVKRGYIHIMAIRVVPVRRVKRYAVYSRQQLASNAQRKARRFAKRHGVSVHDAEAYFSRHKNDELPYVWFCSHSTGQNFGLLIKKQVMDRKEYIQNSTDEFSSYGLSASQPLPEF